MTPDDRLAMFSHLLVMDGYSQRCEESAMTGEWVVFARQDGVNYYLTLARHTEDDEAIFARVANAARDFPQLNLRSFGRDQPAERQI